MSRKALLTIAASAELLIGAYCFLAFIAWTARIYLFTAGQSHFSFAIVVWAALAAICFWGYSRTMVKIRDMESTEAKLAEIDKESKAAQMLRASEQTGEVPNGQTAKS